MPGASGDWLDRPGLLAPLFKELLVQMDQAGTPLAPSNSEIYGRAMLGDTTPITADDYTQDELGVITTLIQNALSRDRNYVEYNDYTKSMMTDGLQPPARGVPQETLLGDMQYDLMGRTSPKAVIQTSLGQFGFEETPHGIRVIDQYNFNPLHQKTTVGEDYSTNWQYDRAGALGTLWDALKNKDWYDAARIGGEMLGPRGSWSGDDSAGMPVDITIPWGDIWFGAEQ